MPVITSSGSSTLVVVAEPRNVSIAAPVASVISTTQVPSVLAVASPGPQGRVGTPGTSGAGVLPPIDFSYGSASPTGVVTLAETSEVTGISLQVEQVFDGVGASVALGVAGDPESLMPAAFTSLASLDTYEFSPRIEYPAGTVLILTIVPGAGASQGLGQIIISTVPSI